MRRFACRIYGFLTAPTVPLWRYCLWLVPIDLLPSYIMVAIAYAALWLAGTDPESHMGPDLTITTPGVLQTVIVAPVVETLILALGLWLLSFLSARTDVIAALSGLGWGSLHGAFGLLSFFGTVWGFFVLSCAYLAWRKVSFAHAYAAAAVPHALGNLIAVLIER